MRHGTLQVSEVPTSDLRCLVVIVVVPGAVSGILEKGHQDLGKIVRGGRLLHRIQFCCGYDLDDWDGFIGLFFGLLKILCIEGDSNWETWKAEALERYREGCQLKQLLKLSAAK